MVGLRCPSPWQILAVGLLVALSTTGCASVPGVKMDLLLNGRPIGQTAMKTYVVATLGPGFHRLDSVAESTSTLKISVNPGRVYYVWQEVTWGLLYARSRLHLVDERTGQAGVRECKLAD
jgi:hypothetical protein